MHKSQTQPLQVSKWVKIPLLVDVHEMRALLTEHPTPFKIYNVQGITPENEGIYDTDTFLEKYSTYIASLKKGEIPPLNAYRSLFSAVWSVDESSIFSMPVEGGRRLLKAGKPCVQTQLNQIRYSEVENAFRTQVYSPDSICWGIQVGFPFLYLNPDTYEASKTREFPNMALFLTIQRWIRNHTLPTPFVVNGEKINTPIRLGKECFSWISSHPQLLQNGIEIDCS